MSAAYVDPRLVPVFEHIAKHGDAFVERLKEYVRHPSISAQNKGIREVAELASAMLGALGMSVEVVETAGHPMVLGRLGSNPSKLTILFYGHYDVQPPEPYDAWVSPPFEPTVRDGRIYARGVGDNKGQHFAQMLAIESYLAVHGELPCNLIFLLEGEEEIGSPQISEFVRANADRLQADLVITSDGPLHISGRPIITFGVRGMVSFDLEVRTAKRDTHSGNYGGVMPNAIWKLVNLLGTMRSADGTITIDGFHDQIIPPTELAHRAAASLPLDLPEFMDELGLSELDEPKGRAFYDRLMFHPTLTINGLNGGYGGEGSKSVLPCEAVAKCDVRLVDAMTPEHVLDKIQEHIARHAPDVELIRRGGMLPSKTPMESEFTSPIKQAITMAHGVEPLLYPSLGASLPDYVFTKTLGIPAFVVPYANADEANHAPNENLKISCFIDGIRSGAAMMMMLGDQER